MNKVAIDLGYSSTKIQYNNQLYKIPTAVSYAGSSTLEYGDNNSYEFEGEKYVVGMPAENSFVTTDYKFLHKFAPLIIYHVLKTIGAPTNNLIEISTGLAISDWAKRDEFKNRIENSEVNDEKLNVIVKNIIPQGAGVYYDYKTTQDTELDNKNAFIIDIGYNTINTLYFENGKPVRDKAAAHVGSGVTTIIKDFTKWLEQRFSLPFSEQEALKIFVKKKFVYQGIEQQDVVKKIEELKSRFISQLFRSILVQEKKLLATSDVVILAGGGVYLLKDSPFPPNVKFVSQPFEFSNVRGYSLFL